jgi:lipase
VLVVHGVTNTGARYRRLAEGELPGCRVIAPDLRGHGASIWDPPWDVGRHVADLIALLDAERIGRATVVGHSFGGMVAMELAAAAPDRVEGVALLDPACGIDPARARCEAEDARHDDGWATVEEARAARLALRPPDARDTVDEDLATFLGRDDDGRYRLRYCRSAVVTAWSEMARPAPSPGPLLWAGAARDRPPGRLRDRRPRGRAATRRRGPAHRAGGRRRSHARLGRARSARRRAARVDGAVSGATSTRRLAWASYGAAIGLALGTVVALAADAPAAGGVGAAVGVIAGVVIGRRRERR